MTRIKQKNKVIITTLIVIFVITGLVFAYIENPKAAIRRKLKGFRNIEFENSGWDRYQEYDIGTIIYVQSKDTIKLPHVYESSGIDFKNKTLLDDGIFDDEELLVKYRKHNEEMSQKAKGVWKVISTNPDSVFFNVPQNPLHGKYAIRFFIDNNGWVSMDMKRNIYKIELTNDSTVLICNKGGVGHIRNVRNWESK
jgi:hypothetical protein